MKWIKRIIISSTFAGIVSILLIGSVLGAAFTANITITNTSTTTYLTIPLSVSNNNTYLSVNGYISPSGADVQLMQGATTLPRMLSDNRTLFVLPTLSALGSSTVTYSTNNTPSDFSIITGYGGYITTANNSSLELSDNGSILINNLLLTTGSVFSKLQALTCSYNGTVLTATANSTSGGISPSVSSNTSGQSASGNSYSPSLPSGVSSGDMMIFYEVAQSTLANSPGTTVTGWTQLFHYIYDANYVELTAWYKVAGAGEAAPAVSINATCNYAWRMVRIPTGTYSGVPVVGTSATATDANPNPPNLAFGWTGKTLVMAFAAGSNTETFSAAPAGYSNFLTNGVASEFIGYADKQVTAASENPGTFTMTGVTVWGANTIAIQGVMTTVSTTVSGTSPVNLAISVNSTSGNFEMWTNGSIVSSSTMGGGSVSTNSSSYIFGTGIASCSNISLVKSGVQQILYQPSTIIIGTTLPNLGAFGATGNGVITWGTNPVGVTVTLGAITSSAISSTSTTGVGTPNVVGVTGSGIGNIHRPNEDLTMPGNELYPTVNTIATLSNIPIVMIWWFVSFVCVIVVLGLVRKYSNSIFASGIMSVVVMAIFCVLGKSASNPNSGGCLEWWQPAVVLLATITQSITDRTNMM